MTNPDPSSAYRERTLYGARLDVEYHANATAEKAFPGAEYELVVAQAFHDPADNTYPLKLYSYTLAPKSTFEPLKPPADGWDGTGTVGEPGWAEASRFTGVSASNIDIYVLYGARCVKAKKWLGAIMVTISVRNPGGNVTDAISVSKELKLSQVGPVLDRAEGETLK